MFKPLLRTFPILNGNIKLCCDIKDIDKEDEKTFSTYIRSCSLQPLQNNLFNRKININLIDGMWEYDVTKFYTKYSDTFYADNYQYVNNDFTKIDINNNDTLEMSRNKNYEFGCKHIYFDNTGYEYDFYAPIYITSADDIPDYFEIKLDFLNNDIKTIKIYINKDSEYNYLKHYLKKYLNKIDRAVIFFSQSYNNVIYYGINVKQGGLVEIQTDNMNKYLNSVVPIHKFDFELCNGFRNNDLIMRQVLPLSFHFNIYDILTSYEKRYYTMNKVKIYGQYVKNGKPIDMYDFDFDYTHKYVKDLIYDSSRNMNTYFIDYRKNNNEPINILNNSLRENVLKNYQMDNTLTPNYFSWKLMLSSDKLPYIINANPIYTNYINSIYGQFPRVNNKINIDSYVTFKNNTLYTFDFNDHDHIKNYNIIKNYYFDNWYTLLNSYSPEYKKISNIFDNDNNWTDVIKKYAYYKGILYNFSNIDEMSDVKKFGVFVSPIFNVSDYINTSDSIYFVKDDNINTSNHLLLNVNNMVNRALEGNNSVIFNFNNENYLDGNIINNSATSDNIYSFYKIDYTEPIDNFTVESLNNNIYYNIDDGDEFEQFVKVDEFESFMNNITKYLLSLQSYRKLSNEIKGVIYTLILKKCFNFNIFKYMNINKSNLYLYEFKNTLLSYSMYAFEKTKLYNNSNSNIEYDKYFNDLNDGYVITNQNLYTDEKLNSYVYSRYISISYISTILNDISHDVSESLLANIITVNHNNDTIQYIVNVENMDDIVYESYKSYSEFASVIESHVYNIIVDLAKLCNRYIIVLDDTINYHISSGQWPTNNDYDSNFLNGKVVFKYGYMKQITKDNVNVKYSNIYIDAKGLNMLFDITDNDYVNELYNYNFGNKYNEDSAKYSNYVMGSYNNTTLYDSNEFRYIFGTEKTLENTYQKNKLDIFIKNGDRDKVRKVSYLMNKYNITYSSIIDLYKIINRISTTNLQKRSLCKIDTSQQLLFEINNDYPITFTFDKYNANSQNERYSYIRNINESIINRFIVSFCDENSVLNNLYDEDNLGSNKTYKIFINKDYTPYIIFGDIRLMLAINYYEIYNSVYVPTKQRKINTYFDLFEFYGNENFNKIIDINCINTIFSFLYNETILKSKDYNDILKSEDKDINRQAIIIQGILEMNYNKFAIFFDNYKFDDEDINNSNKLFAYLRKLLNTKENYDSNTFKNYFYAIFNFINKDDTKYNKLFNFIKTVFDKTLKDNNYFVYKYLYDLISSLSVYKIEYKNINDSDYYIENDHYVPFIIFDNSLLSFDLKNLMSNVKCIERPIDLYASKQLLKLDENFIKRINEDKFEYYLFRKPFNENDIDVYSLYLDQINVNGDGVNYPCVEIENKYFNDNFINTNNKMFNIEYFIPLENNHNKMIYNTVDYNNFLSMLTNGEIKNINGNYVYNNIDQSFLVSINDGEVICRILSKYICNIINNNISDINNIDVYIMSVLIELISNSGDIQDDIYDIILDINSYITSDEYLNIITLSTDVNNKLDNFYKLLSNSIKSYNESLFENIIVLTDADLHKKIIDNYNQLLNSLSIREIILKNILKIISIYSDDVDAIEIMLLILKAAYIINSNDTNSSRLSKFITTYSSYITINIDIFNNLNTIITYIMAKIFDNISNSKSKLVFENIVNRLISNYNLVLYNEIQENNVTFNEFDFIEIDNIISNEYDKNLKIVSYNNEKYAYYLINVNINNNGAYDLPNSQYEYFSTINNLKLENTSECKTKFINQYFNELIPILNSNIYHNFLLNIKTLQNPIKIEQLQGYKITEDRSNIYKRIYIVNDELYSEKKYSYNIEKKYDNSKMILYRYFNYIEPLLTKHNIVNNQFNKIYKNSNMIFRDDNIYYENIDINKYNGLVKIDDNNYSEMDNINTYSRVIPFEYKHYNDNQLYLLIPKFEYLISKPMNYETLLENENYENTLKIFKYYISNIYKKSLDDDTEILFLFNKYKVSYISENVKLNFGGTEKLYTLKYIFTMK